MHYFIYTQCSHVLCTMGHFTKYDFLRGQQIPATMPFYFNGGIDRLILSPCGSDWFKIHPNHCKSGERVLEIRLPLSLLKATCKQGIWSTAKANRSAF